MTDREKLIALLKGNLPNHSNEVAYWSDEHIGALADHLLANGVVVREKGEWDDSGRYTFEDGSLAIRCNQCGAALHKDEWDKYNWHFCPNCGADMRKGENG